MKRFGGSWKPGAPLRRYALIGVPRGGAGAVEASGDELDLRAAAGQKVAPFASLPRPVHVRVTAGAIEIQVGDDEPFRTSAPLAVLVLNEAGRVRSRLVPVSSDTLRPAFEEPRAFRLAVSMTCEGIGDRQWHNISRVVGRQLLVRLNNYRAYDGGGVFYVAAETPLAVRVQETLGSDAARLTIEPLDRESRRARLATDALSAPALEEATYLSRIEVRMNDGGGEATAVLGLGAEPSAIWALGNADRVALPRVSACRRTVLSGGRD